LISDAPRNNEEFPLSCSFFFPLRVFRALPPKCSSYVSILLVSSTQALKDAGLVSGDSSDPKAWQLPEHLKDRTAVLFAASYPGLDATVAEVMRYAESQAPKGASVGKLVRELRRRLEACKVSVHDIAGLKSKMRLNDKVDTLFIQHLLLSLFSIFQCLLLLLFLKHAYMFTLRRHPFLPLLLT
jgi:hypothetical protein